MSRQRDVDWSDWKGVVQASEHPLSRPLDSKLKKGADAVKEALTTGQLPVIQDAPAQPTDEQMFGHLVVSEEELKKKEADWVNGHQNKLKELSKPIDHLNKSKVEGSWGLGKSFNSMLSDKEREERNSFIGE